jgi:hypothetical protein
MATSKAMQQFAEDYGYQLAFLKSDPGLYKIFQNAVGHGWDATRFVAAVKASPWYKTHGEAYRQNLALKTTDPATWKQQVASQRAQIGDIAQGMGAPVPGAAMERITEQSILMGWNDAQIKDQLARYININATHGDAAKTAYAIRETAYRNGVSLSKNFVEDWQRKIATGIGTLQDAQQQIRSTYAKTLAPGFAHALDGGMDLADVAAPYMQTMAQTLELNPSEIDLFNPTIRKAMSGSKMEKGGTVESTPLWEFENQLRQDPRYMKTKQAQDQVMSVASKVLNDFGLKAN